MALWQPRTAHGTALAHASARTPPPTDGAKLSGIRLPARTDAIGFCVFGASKAGPGRLRRSTLRARASIAAVSKALASRAVGFSPSQAAEWPAPQSASSESGRPGPCRHTARDAASYRSAEFCRGPADGSWSVAHCRGWLLAVAAGMRARPSGLSLSLPASAGGKVSNRPGRVRRDRQGPAAGEELRARDSRRRPPQSRQRASTERRPPRGLWL